jgi:hypothetical protein
VEPLDERARRKPGFDEVNSAPVTLADGQTWFLPKPWYEVYASFKGGRSVGTRPTLTCGPELDALIEAIGGCEDAHAMLSGAATLGARLMLANYDLADEDLDRLFCYRPREPESWQWGKAVMDVATGLAGVRNFPGGADSR